METPVTIKAIVISQAYEAVEPLMEGLHDHERMLNSRTLPWAQLRERYMAHVIDMQQQNEGICLVAYLADEPIGFIFGYLAEEDEGEIEAIDGNELYISDGFVKEQFRGTGVYKQLNARLEASYAHKNIARISRFTLMNNQKARRFMEKENYVATRVLYEKWLK